MKAMFGKPAPSSGLNENLLYSPSSHGSFTSPIVNIQPTADAHTSCVSRLSLICGIGKVVFGCLLMIFGVLSLLHGSTLGYIGAGFWGGLCVVISGVLLLVSARNPLRYSLIVSSLSMSIGGLGISGLVVLFCAVGISRDFTHLQEAEASADSGGEHEFRRQALILNGVLLVLSAMDILLSLLCIFFSARQLCACASSALDAGAAARQSDKPQLWRWLSLHGQMFYWQQPPGATLAPLPITAENSVMSIGQPARSITAASLMPVALPSIYQSRNHAATVHSYTGQGVAKSSRLRTEKTRKEMTSDKTSGPAFRRNQRDTAPATQLARDTRAGTRDARSGTRNARRVASRTPSPPSTPVDQIYTGLDREMAEEFIETTMNSYNI